MNRRLCFASVHAKNYKKTVEFYRDAIGIKLKHGRDYEHYEASWQNPYLHFAIFPSGKAQPRLAFFVEDIQKAHKRAVNEGAKVVFVPKKMPWGITAEYLDPDGNHVGLVQSKLD